MRMCARTHTEEHYLGLLCVRRLYSGPRHVPRPNTGAARPARAGVIGNPVCTSSGGVERGGSARCPGPGEGGVCGASQYLGCVTGARESSVGRAAAASRAQHGLRGLRAPRSPRSAGPSLPRGSGRRFFVLRGCRGLDGGPALGARARERGGRFAREKQRAPSPQACMQPPRTSSTGGDRGRAPPGSEARAHAEVRAGRAGAFARTWKRTRPGINGHMTRVCGCLRWETASPRLENGRPVEGACQPPAAGVGRA